jgi:hypothetical protein
MYFNEFWMTNLRKYEHIIYENSDFMSQDWEKINQKFVWLKVASINISRSKVPGCAPFLLVPFVFDIDRNKSFLNRNGLIFKKVTSKILNEYHRFQWTRCRHFHKWHVAKIRGPHWVTLHKYKATWISLLINENSKSTFTTQLRHPLTWALLLVLFQKLHDGKHKSTNQIAKNRHT